MKLTLYAKSKNRFTEAQLEAFARLRNLHELTLPFWGYRKKVPIYRIVRLEGEGNYTVLHFNDGTRLMVSLTLKKLESRLPAELFVRPHKKNIVNLLYLQEIRPDKSKMIVLVNGDEIEVSRRKCNQFVKRVEHFLENLPVPTASLGLATA